MPVLSNHSLRQRLDGRSDEGGGVHTVMSTRNYLPQIAWTIAFDLTLADVLSAWS